MIPSKIKIESFAKRCHMGTPGGKGLNAAQNLVAEHYIIEFYMIFHHKAAQNLVGKHYERDFNLIFRLKADQNLVVEHCE